METCQMLSVFDYEPSTGNLYYKVDRGPKKAGDLVGFVTRKGYRKVKFDGKTYFCHNIIWYIQTNVWPRDFTVDHINRDTLDNRWCNLRAANRGQQQANAKGWGKGSYKGVCWHKGRKKYMAYCNRRHLGYFDSEEEAALAYNEAALEVWGEFAYLNNVGDGP